MRIAITTGGGDAPGLNAAIRAVVLSASQRGWQCFGIRRGFLGLMEGDGVMPLGPAEVRGITHLGGTILGTTNRGNPFRWPLRQAGEAINPVSHFFSQSSFPSSNLQARITPSISPR